MPRAEVISYSVTLGPFGVVVGVAVSCPNGCTEGRGRHARPKLHHHGWTRTSGTDGGERSAHCTGPHARGYDLFWPSGVPADAVAALLEQEYEEALRCARKAAHA